MLNLIPTVRADELILGKIGDGEELADPGDINWAQILTTLLQLILVIGIIVMLAQIIMGAFKIMSGEPSKIDEGRKKIVWSIIGVLILASSLVILMIVQRLLGIEAITIS